MKIKQTMRNKTIWLGLILALFLCGNAFGQTETPEQTAKDFYKWYLQELNSERYPINRQKSEILKKVSKRLGRWLYSPAYEEFGADYFLNAQNWDENWVNGVTTSKATIRGNIATVKVSLAVPKGTHTNYDTHNLTVKLVKEGGTWKIDRINNY